MTRWASARAGELRTRQREHIIDSNGSQGTQGGRRGPRPGEAEADADGGSTAVAERFEITLGDGAADQDQEWCEVALNGERRRIRFHDYDEIYSIPGLYEEIFYELLECDSPRTLCGLLGETLAAAERPPEELRVLDLGAGNGMVGEELRELGVDSIVGADLLPEAAEAAERDRPGTYDQYLVGDFTQLDGDTLDRLRATRLNCLTTVAALGFGDIPPAVFCAAAELVEPDGWLVFNIKDNFLADGDETGFARLIREAIADGVLEVAARKRYRHRNSTAGRPLHYIGFVARKRGALRDAG